MIDHLNPQSLPQKSHEQFIEKDHFYWRREHRIRQEFIRRYPFVSRAWRLYDLFV
jgi:hypothetical protein